VNYYFRDKEKLYVEAWRVASERSLSAHPPDGGVPPEAPAEERLRGRILAVMQRLGDESNCEFEIMHRELANPTGCWRRWCGSTSSRCGATWRRY